MGDTLKTLARVALSAALSFCLAFGLVKMMPGQFASEETQLSESFSRAHQFEFFPMAGAYLQGDWGSSWAFPGQSVIDLILQAFKKTSGLQLLAFLLITGLSFLLSSLTLQSKIFSQSLRKILAVGVALPQVILAPLAVYILVLKMGWVPLRFDGSWQAYGLATLCLGLRPLCFSTGLLTQAWSKTQFEDYFRVARGKGLSMFQAYLRHGLKNSSLTYLTQLGQILAQLLTGSFLIESLLAYPGLGTLFVESLRERDLPVLMGVVFVYTWLYFLIQGLVENLYFKLEPRAREGRQL
ncbi:MAG: ABC transporter permease [Bdellovibrionales bacterium]